MRCPLLAAAWLAECPTSTAPLSTCAVRVRPSACAARVRQLSGRSGGARTHDQLLWRECRLAGGCEGQVRPNGLLEHQPTVHPWGRQQRQRRSRVSGCCAFPWRIAGNRPCAHACAKQHRWRRRCRAGRCATGGSCGAAGCCCAVLDWFSTRDAILQIVPFERCALTFNLPSLPIPSTATLSHIAMATGM